MVRVSVRRADAVLPCTTCSCARSRFTSHFAKLVTFSGRIRAGTGAGQGTIPVAINPAGTIDGLYYDGNNVMHGFIRAADGTLITFDVPGAGTGSFQGTEPVGSNPAGATTGHYVDAKGVAHGFLRTARGTFTLFDVPDAGNGPGQGTFAYEINGAGAITGFFVDVNDALHGFLRPAEEQ